jgi:DNA polymerase-3 subunit chi
MISQADFYLIDADYEQERVDFLCRLVEKAWQQQLKIYIYTESSAQAEQVDEGLWHFKPQSFLPHGIEHNLAPDKRVHYPVIIGVQDTDHSDSTSSHSDLLINISKSLPPFYKAFQRYVEITPPQPQALQQSRQHYRTLNQEKIKIQHHDLRRK